MAAITPATLIRESIGSKTLLIANFAATADTGDTWTTGLAGITSVMACQADASGTQASTGAGASFVASTGVVTLVMAEDNTAITLWVLGNA